MSILAAGNARRRTRTAAGSALATAALVAGMVTAAGTASAAPPAAPNLGPNTYVFTPATPQATIQSTLDAIYAQQATNQFGDQRYAVLFEPGTYGSAMDPLIFQLGYYTQVAGLGESPSNVVINGAVDVFDQCTPGGDCNALDNFWRSMSNLTINATGDIGFGCYGNTEMWAVSQAAPMRRVAVNGTISLFDYCGDGTFGGSHDSSGGFIADSAFANQVISGSQQQFLTRNSDLNGGWSNGVWNQVFSGDNGAPATVFPPANGSGPYTTLATTPVSREEPYLYVDANGRYHVFVPSAQQNSVGTTWANGQTPGSSLPISDFYVASPGDSAAKINLELLLGKNLIFTPGVYQFSQSINVLRPDTVVLGLGLATIEPTNGNVAMAVGDAPGEEISGLIFDAGPKNSPVLLQVGPNRGILRGFDPFSNAKDPSTIQDVFFRIGGEHVGKATESLEVNNNHVVLDDVWAWRADHGNPGTVGWTTNTARNGLVVNGDNVEATGLFVEHYQQYDVLWNGNSGETIMFQNEMPYDPPTQAAWEHDGELGYAAYKVAATVKTHQGYGLGSYIYTNVNPLLHATNAFEVPTTKGVVLHDLLTISLNYAGTIDHVVDGVGAATVYGGGPVYLAQYPS